MITILLTDMFGGGERMNQLPTLPEIRGFLFSWSFGLKLARHHFRKLF